MVFAAMANAERIKHMAIAKHALQSNKCKKKIDLKIFFNSSHVPCDPCKIYFREYLLFGKQLN